MSRYHKMRDFNTLLQNKKLLVTWQVFQWDGGESYSLKANENGIDIFPVEP